ncbi:hypothetical protein [Streptomyces sp. NPDC127114]|uniref:hypothetical protein n=1 Tax=Streptomyces sp. NPDC127114 TaxID=3345366 RepID=UPI0036300EC8
MELDGMAPASRGPLFADGWDEGVTAVREALVASRIGTGHARGGRSAGAAELAVHIAYMRQREQVDLVWLERFVRETVLPRTHPNTTQWRRVLEALGEAGGLCAAREAEMSSGGVIFCTRARPGTTTRTTSRPSWTEKPGGWHLADVSIWDNSAYAHLHKAI